LNNSFLQDKRALRCCAAQAQQAVHLQRLAMAEICGIAHMRICSVLCDCVSLLGYIAPLFALYSSPAVIGRRQRR
jgi:hypothetical protein